MSESSSGISKSTLAAIVFTDAVGFSAFARDDEAGALAAIAADHRVMQTLCAQHEGRVVKSTGDGLLLMFDSAVAAFQCSLAILRELPDSPLQHRIGVHLGDVTETNGDVMGDGVNVASRLQELARPGEMCASQTVVDVVQSRLKFSLRSMGVQTLKNIPQPMRIYGVDPFAQDAKKSAIRPRWNARAFGWVVGSLAVLAIGVPLWILVLRPPPTEAIRDRGPVTLSPELARYLEHGAQDAPDSASSLEPTPEQKALAAKVAELESLQGWFEKEMKGYTKEKPLTLPAQDGAQPTKVWADASNGVMAQGSDGQQPDKVRATNFVRATHHLIDRMPDGAEKNAMLKKLEGLAVPRRPAEKTGGEPGQPPSSAFGMVRNLPAPKDFQVRMKELEGLNATVGDALKGFRPDKPFQLETPGGTPLSLWFDDNGQLVGATGDGAAAPVEVATYMRVARSVVESMPPGPRRDETLKALENLARRRGKTD